MVPDTDDSRAAYAQYAERLGTYVERRPVTGTRGEPFSAVELALGRAAAALTANDILALFDGVLTNRALARCLTLHESNVCHWKRPRPGMDRVPYAYRLRMLEEALRRRLVIVQEGRVLVRRHGDGEPLRPGWTQREGRAA